MLNQELLYNVTGQRFFYDVVEGRPSAPAATVYLSTADDDATAEVATNGAASVDACDTELDGAVDAGAQTITVADATNVFRGRQYLLTDADTGVTEWLDIVAKNGATLGLRQPLRNSYADASPFQGTRITIAVLDAWVQNKAKLTDVLGATWRTSQEAQPWTPGMAGYRIRWTYTLDGATELGVSFADLVRYQAKNLVTPLHVDRRFPGWIDRLPTDDVRDQGAGLIAQAFTALRMDALGDEQLVRRIRNTEVLRELTIYRANVVAQEAAVFAGSGTRDGVALASELYERRYKQLVREPKVPVDQTGGGSSSQPRRTPATRR